MDIVNCAIDDIDDDMLRVCFTPCNGDSDCGTATWPCKGGSLTQCVLALLGVLYHQEARQLLHNILHTKSLTECTETEIRVRSQR